MPNRAENNGSAVSNSFADEQTASFALFGWSIYLAWKWVEYQTSIVAPLNTASGTGDFGRLLALLVQAITLTVILLFFRCRKGKTESDKSIAYVASAAGVAGTALLVIAGHFDGAVLHTLLIGGWIFVGLCGAFCTCLWLRLFSTISAQKLCFYFAGSLVLGAVLVYVLCYVPAPVSQVSTALFPAASMLLSLYARQHTQYIQKFEEQRQLCESGTRKSPRTSRLLIVMAIYALVFSALIGPISTRGGYGLESNGGLFLVPSIVAGLLVLAITRLTSKISSLSLIYRTVLSIMVATLVIIPFVSGTYLYTTGFLGSLGFELYNIICLVIISDSAEREKAPKVRMLTRGRIYYFWGYFFGTAISMYLVANDLYKDKSLFIILCLAATVILVVATTLVLGEPEPAFNPQPQDGSLSSSQEFAMPSPEEIFEYKALRIAARYKLTPREIDVFLLLSKGRSNRLIEERLVISEHTVDSHVTHIYRKCNVHSRQEIMDLIEQEHVDMSELAQHASGRSSAGE